MSPAQHERCYGALLDRAQPGARLIYWNMMVPRGVPAHFADQVRSLDELARTLHERDRAFFYQSFHVNEVGAEVGAEDVNDV